VDSVCSSSAGVGRGKQVELCWQVVLRRQSELRWSNMPVARWAEVLGCCRLGSSVAWSYAVKLSRVGENYLVGLNVASCY